MQNATRCNMTCKVLIQISVLICCRDKLVYWNDYPMIYQEQDGSAADIDQVLHELGGGAVVRLVPSEQNGRANVGPAPMDQDVGVVDQLADGLGNLDLNLRM